MAALGDAARHDPSGEFASRRYERSGRIGGPDAEKTGARGRTRPTPWVRDVAVRELGNFKDDASLPSRLSGHCSSDPAYRVRAAALGALARIHAPNAFDTLAAAVKSDSPDDTLREASLRAFGRLGDTRAVPILMEWSAVGKPIGSRQAAIGAIAELDKPNNAITRMLISFLDEPYFDVRIAAIFALAARGDTRRDRSAGGLAEQWRPYRGHRTVHRVGASGC